MMDAKVVGRASIALVEPFVFEDGCGMGYSLTERASVVAWDTF